MKHVADGVVFQGKECVEKLETEPPILVEASFGQVVVVTEEEIFFSVLSHCELAVDSTFAESYRDLFR